MRRDTIFSIALELAHRGLDEDLIAYCMTEVNRRRCSPPLGDDDVRKQAHGAIVRARQRPSQDHELNRRALAQLARIPVPVMHETDEHEPPKRERGRPRVQLAQAKEIIVDVFVDGPAPSEVFKAEGERQGVPKRTIELAAKEIGVLVESGPREGGGRMTIWHPPSSLSCAIDRARSGRAITEPVPSVGVSERGSRYKGSCATNSCATKSADREHFLRDEIEGRSKCSHEDFWKARDRIFRCLVCEPPNWPGEVVETLHFERST